MSDITALESRLDDFDPQVRREALEELAAARVPTAPATDNLNMHCHSFFSYNADGWSPSHISWAAHLAGLYAAGLCDFDVLDGLEEFLAAGQLLGLRSTVNLETRVYFREYADVDITSPGEPGVTYIMGAGFVTLPPPGTSQHAGLCAYRDAACARNVDLVNRINPHVPDIAIDYELDVLPLTPMNAATERHIIRAYVNKAAEVNGSPERTAQFWSEILGKPAADLEPILDSPDFEELVRSKLAKRGGLGYVQPSEDTFPPVDDFIQWVLSCDAIPMITWLDGTSGGEEDGRAMLECMVAKGAAALNIIPDRNWNIKDPEARERKIGKLREIVAIADDMNLPINIGTEMNKAGLPFVDDLGGPVLIDLRESFMRGARIMVGHTVMARFVGMSYVACDMDLPRKNAFFESVGALPAVNDTIAEALTKLGPDMAMQRISESAAAGVWRV
ncbi:MAG: hypothetical protein HPY44_19430 [Armatimonadetes bacterium]|nr:hypothetical protein [Armatimonadota bacterium]